MTMNGGPLRHTACKSCRERKVRCGGEQPSCAKCRATGEECVYLPTQRPTRADLTRTVEALQKRLYETEARISRIINKDSEQQGGNAMVAPSPPIHAVADAAWPTGAESPGPTVLFQCPLPSFASSTADGNPLTGLAQNPSSPQSLTNDFLSSLQPSANHQTATRTNDTMHFSREEDGRNHRTGFTDVDSPASLGFSAFGPESNNYHQHGQGYAFASATFAANGGNTIASSSSATLNDPAATRAITGAMITPPVTTPPRSTEITADTSPPVASLLAEFSASVFRSQAEIAGISSAVAEYLAWMRKAPTGGTAPPNTSLVYVNVLEAVESRLREMREIAQTRPRAAFRDMVAALQALGPTGASVCDSLAHLEEDFERQSAEVADFFQTRYNACAALSEQTQNLDRASSSKERPGGGSGHSSQQPP